jgi:hypothetical protein
MAIHGLPRLQEIAARQMDIVDQIGDVALRQGRLAWNRFP